MTAPSELQQYDQWVLWRLEGRGQKNTKVPYTIRGTNASSTNPRSWSSYQDVCDAYDAAQGRYSGIGFVLTESDPFVGVDLDHCIKDGELEQWAQDIVDKIQSYTEVTPSGEGLRIFVKGTLPQEGRKRGNFEVYSHSRYLTITGNHLPGTPTEIFERQAELLEIHSHVFSRSLNGHSDSTSPEPSDWADAYLIEQALAAKNGQKFKDLWTGNWQTRLKDKEKPNEFDSSAPEREWPSKSEADLALASLLSFWTGRNPETVDRLFRQSKLMSDKWDERHYADGRTYGEGTIDFAVRTSGSYFESQKLETSKAQDIRREHAMGWLQGQPGFNQLAITGVRQIGRHIGGIFQLISADYGPLDIGSIGDLGSWLKPRANIMARTPVVLPPLYSKKEHWNQVLDTLITLVHENGGPEDDAGSPGEVIAEAVYRFAITWDSHRFNLKEEADRLSIIHFIQSANGAMENARCFISTEGNVILQAQAFATWLHSQYNEALSAKAVGQDLTRLGFKSKYVLEAHDPDSQKRMAVKVFISPKNFLGE